MLVFQVLKNVEVRANTFVGLMLIKFYYCDGACASPRGVQRASVNSAHCCGEGCAFISRSAGGVLRGRERHPINNQLFCHLALSPET